MKHRYTFVLTALCALLAFSLVAGAAELEMWECWGGNRTEWIREYIEAFENEHPGITVNLMTHGCHEIADKFMAAYAAGIAPDLIMFQTFDIVAFADQGMLLSIDSYMERDGLSRDMWYPSELYSGLWDGVQYGLPVRSGGDANTILYLNVDHFEEAGLDVNNPPRTLDQLKEVGQRLVRYAADDTLVRAPMDVVNVVDSDFYNVAWIYAGGGTFLAEDLRRPAFTQGGAVQVFEKLQEINQSWYRNPEDGTRARFETEEASMVHTGAWRWSSFKEHDVNFKVIPLPRLSEEIPHTGAHIGTWHYVIPSTAQADEAWELLKWLGTREDTLGDFLLRQGRLAPIVSLNQNPQYLEVNPDVYALSEAMSLAASVPMLPISRELMTIHGQAAQSAVLGKESVVNALHNAGEQVAARLSEYWGREQ